ncbi:MAG: hypothetical protein KC438_16620, partial [Thermomicrobiales bacterium]|nr:hypothetical protein [Thermomicrobiales bacterium]
GDYTVTLLSDLNGKQHVLFELRVPWATFSAGLHRGLDLRKSAKETIEGKKREMEALAEG